MDDRRRHDQPEKPDPSETVRIIGEDEAQEAQRSGRAAPRRPDDAKRPGDRPDPPEGPRPRLRFPRGDASDDDAGGRPRVARPAGPELPHWTEPATGEVPQIGGQADEGGPREGGGVGDDLSAWSTFATGSPRWRDQPSDWEEADYEDASRLADESTRIGALDTRRARHDDFFEDIPVAGSPSQPDRREPPLPGGAVPSEPPVEVPMGRNVPMAVGTGLGFAGVALFLFSQGPGPTAALVTVVIVVAAAELFGSLQRSGYQPATLLGLVASGAMVAGAYWRGEAAHPLILALTVVFGFLWYLTGVSRARPVLNVGVTVLGVAYVGLLGSFAALLLKWPHDNGVGLLLGAVIATVGYDVGGFFIGRRIGQSPLAPEISPHKTYEGLVGGMAVSVLVSVAIVSQIHPWDFGSALALGVMASIVAPLGDLSESMLKRDLGIKDTGGVLPGHGGLLDRFDGLLFVLPATYYLARVLDLGLG